VGRVFREEEGGRRTWLSGGVGDSTGELFKGRIQESLTRVVSTQGVKGGSWDGEVLGGRSGN